MCHKLCCKVNKNESVKQTAYPSETIKITLQTDFIAKKEKG